MSMELYIYTSCITHLWEWGKFEQGVFLLAFIGCVIHVQVNVYNHAVHNYLQIYFFSRGPCSLFCIIHLMEQEYTKTYAWLVTSEIQYIHNHTTIGNVSSLKSVCAKFSDTVAALHTSNALVNVKKHCKVLPTTLCVWFA